MQALGSASAIGGLVIAGLSVVAVTSLTPLKEAFPFVIEVDKTSGETNIVTTIKKQTDDLR